MTPCATPRTIARPLGNTPLVKLNHVTEGIAAPGARQGRVPQPGRSSKDRIATRIIDAAEASGELQPGGTIVEPTSRQHRRRPRARRPAARATAASSSARQGRRGQAQRAHGLRRRGRRHPDLRRARPPRLLLLGLRPARRARSPGAFKPNQYANPNGPAQPLRDHRPEIWARHRRADHALRRRRRHRRHDHRHRAATSRRSPTGACASIGADPEGSVYSGGTGRPYLVEGVGEDFWPTRVRPDASPTRSSPSSDAESFAMTRRLAREEGLLVGGSSGMAVVAAARGRAATSPAPTPSSSCCCPTAAAATSARSSTTRGCAPTASATPPTSARSATCSRQGRRDCPTSCTRTRRHRARRRSTSCASTASRRCPCSAPSRRSMAARSSAR